MIPAVLVRAMGVARKPRASGDDPSKEDNSKGEVE